MTSVVVTAINATTTLEDMLLQNETFPSWLAKIKNLLWSNVEFILNLIRFLLLSLKTIIREAALKAVLQSKKSFKIAVPWWNKERDIAVKKDSTP